MAKHKPDSQPGHARLLDAWDPPADAGDPVGCVATSFTFDAAFFEEECLARFLHLESDPTEDGPAYVVEREEKLSQVSCAAALVDQHHCRGERSLRWDLLPARMPKGIQHAKVSLLVWANRVRVVVASANLTEDGYRRNLEVFGVLDFFPECDTPRACLTDAVNFLRRVADACSPTGDRSPALARWHRLLDDATQRTKSWGDESAPRGSVRVKPVFVGPKYPDLFASLRENWPESSPPKHATVLSPFFDVSAPTNAPAEAVWKLLRQRGEAGVWFAVSAEDVPDGGVLLKAPKTILEATPVRATATAEMHRVRLGAGRPLHAKGVWLEGDRWVSFLIGSSNFTSAGTGIGQVKNFEANLVYSVDYNDANAGKQFDETFPKHDPVNIDRVQWQPAEGDGEDDTRGEVLLPAEFRDAVYDRDDTGHATVTFTLGDNPPAGWEVTANGDERPLDTEPQWHARGRPKSFTHDWPPLRPPSGFWVRWAGSDGAAWWPVNVLRAGSLPPPDELAALPLEVLIQLLSSARPLHRVLAEYLRRQAKKGTGGGAVVVDPHAKVDTRSFLLQRTRRVSAALTALRERLERPAATAESLHWRLLGPVGVMAFAEALVREAQSAEEKSFLLAELALELSRVKPTTATGCLPLTDHRAEIRQVIPQLQSMIPPPTDGEPTNLRVYVESVFAHITS